MLNTDGVLWLSVCIKVWKFKLLLQYVWHFVQLTIQYSTVRYRTGHYSTGPCCIQAVCCGFLFVLLIRTFNLLLQYVCHLFSRQYCTIQYSAVYRLCVVAFSLHCSLHYSFEHVSLFAVCLHFRWMSVTFNWILLSELCIMNYWVIFFYIEEESAQTFTQPYFSYLYAIM